MTSVHEHPWIKDWKSFLDDADGVRLDPEARDRFLHHYSREIAPGLDGLTEAFSVWAHKLAYIHPPRYSVFPLKGNHQNNYASEYTLCRTLVDHKAQVVVHALRPKVGKGRFIVLFRGTAQTPANYYHRVSGRLLSEPSGWGPDFDMDGVAFSSFEEILPRLKLWYRGWATEDGVTFIGHSLGGALALRAMSQRALELYQQSRQRSKDVAFIYSSAGLDHFSAVRLSDQFDEQAIRFVWHKHDIVPKAGHFPPVSGTRIVGSKGDGFPELRGNGIVALLRGVEPRHNIPFLAVKQKWKVVVHSENCSYHRTRARDMLEAFRGLRLFGASWGCVLDARVKHKAKKTRIKIAAMSFGMDGVGDLLVSKGMKERLAKRSTYQQY